MGNLSLVKLKGIVPAKSAPMKSGMFLLEQVFAECFLLPLVTFGRLSSLIQHIFE